MSSKKQTIPGLPSCLANIVDYSDSEDDEQLPVQTVSSQSVVEHLMDLIIEEIVVIKMNQAMINYQPNHLADDHFTEDSEDDSSDSSTSDESTSSESSSLFESSDESSENDDDDDKSVVKRIKPPPRTKREIIQLPPIEDLCISVAREETIHIGNIDSIVNDLVVVKAFQNMPAVDIDSLFFLDEGTRPLGKVFDVFGPVYEPYYSVRFNSNDHIKDKKVVKGASVYFAPKTEHTSYIFVTQLRQMKGSDASWRHDEEPPEHRLDYSDDEKEKKAKQLIKNKKLQDQGITIKKENVPSKKFKTNSNENNPFYRTERRYNSRNYGPVTWNSMHVPTYRPVNQQQPTISQQPPQTQSISNPYQFLSQRISQISSQNSTTSSNIPKNHWERDDDSQKNNLKGKYPSPFLK